QQHAQLAGLTPPAEGILRLSLGDAFAGLQGMISPIGDGVSRWGFLLVGLPFETPAPLVTVLEGLLTWAGHTLALHFRLEEDRQRLRQDLRAERRELADLVTAGEAMIGVAHRLNNSLNTMMLQAAILETKVAPSLREEVALIRREGAQAAAELSILQQFREQSQLAGAPVDLNTVLREVLADWPELAGRIRLEFASDLPLLTTSGGALKRLIPF